MAFPEGQPLPHAFTKVLDELMSENTSVHDFFSRPSRTKIPSVFPETPLSQAVLEKRKAAGEFLDAHFSVFPMSEDVNADATCLFMDFEAYVQDSYVHSNSHMQYGDLIGCLFTKIQVAHVELANEHDEEKKTSLSSFIDERKAELSRVHRANTKSNLKKNFPQ
ncbi:MAG: hypothetical protein KA035_01560 [Candidatus Levybacteria bacterium]|nr:hypothetical protein [Candidatus Levybacteria bacterium]